jgi:hypothetical protein
MNKNNLEPFYSISQDGKPFLDNYNFKRFLEVNNFFKHKPNEQSSFNIINRFDTLNCLNTKTLDALSAISYNWLNVNNKTRFRTITDSGKYSVVNPNDRDDYNYIVDMTISFLVREIRNDIEMAQNNEKLTIWTTLLGDFNEHGLRQYPPIKVRNKRPDPMLFHMRYYRYYKS